MSEAKEKMLKRLEELIIEGEKLKNTGIQLNDPAINMWHMKCEKILDRIGGEKLIGEFNSAGAFAFNMRMSDGERVEHRKMQVEGRTNFLQVTKEDLKLFDDTDEPVLKKIKHKFEGGVNLGFVKGKYTQERD